MPRHLLWWGGVALTLGGMVFCLATTGQLAGQFSSVHYTTVQSVRSSDRIASLLWRCLSMLSAMRGSDQITLHLLQPHQADQKGRKTMSSVLFCKPQGGQEGCPDGCTPLTQRAAKTMQIGGRSCLCGWWFMPGTCCNSRRRTGSTLYQTIASGCQGMNVPLRCSWA